MLSDVNLQSTSSPSFLPPKTAVDACLVVRNSLDEVIRSWDISQSKCTIGKAENCTVRCDLEGIADIHALLVVGTRQTFVRALAPGLTHAGVPVNEILLESPDDEFGIAGHRFALVRDANKKLVSTGFQQNPAASGLKFSLTSQPGAVPGKQPSQTLQVAESIEQQTKWMTDLIQSAVGPLECQIQDLCNPIAELQRESRRQKQFRKKRAAARKRRLEQETAQKEEAKQADRTERDEFNKEIETIVTKHAANVDALSERINDVSHQLSAIERIVSQENAEESGELETQLETQVQQAAIEQLQAGIVTVSAALSELQDKQAAQNADNEQWKQEVREQFSAINNSLEQASETQQLDPELKQTLARLEEQQIETQADVNSWKESIGEQLASLHQQVEAKEASGQEIPAQISQAVEEIRGQHSATLEEITSWKLDLLEELQTLKTHLDQRVATLGEAAEIQNGKEIQDDPQVVGCSPTELSDYSARTQTIEQFEQVPNESSDFNEVDHNGQSELGFGLVDQQAANSQNGFGESQPASPEANEGWPAFDLSTPVESALLSTHDSSDSQDEVNSPSDSSRGFEELNEEVGGSGQAVDQLSQFEQAESLQAESPQIAEEPENQEQGWPQFNFGSEQLQSDDSLPFQGDEAVVQDVEASPAQEPNESPSNPLTLAQLEAEERAAEEQQSQESPIDPVEFAFEQQTIEPSLLSEFPEGVSTQAEDLTITEDAVDGIEDFTFGEIITSSSESFIQADSPEIGYEADGSLADSQFSTVVESQQSESVAFQEWQLESEQPGAADGIADVNPQSQVQDLQQVDDFQQLEDRDVDETSGQANVTSGLDEFAFGGESFTSAVEDASEIDQLTTAAESSPVEENQVEEEFFGLTQLPNEPLSELQENSLDELPANSAAGLEEEFGATANQSAEFSTDQSIEIASQEQEAGMLPSWWTEQQSQESTPTEENWSQAKTDSANLANESSETSSASSFEFGNFKDGSETQGDLTQELLQRRLQLDEQQQAGEQLDAALPVDEQHNGDSSEQPEFFGLTAGLTDEPDVAEVEPQDGGFADTQPEFQSAAESTAAPLEQPAVGFADAASAEEPGDESVEDYMQKLLARMRGEEVPETPAPAPAPVPQPAAKPTESVQPIEGSDSQRAADGPATVTHASEETEPFDLDQYVPVASAPEKNRNLEAMRDLANSSARTAIQKSTTQRVFTTAVLKLAIASISMTVGAVLLVINGLSMNIGLIATGAAFLLGIFWGYDGAVTLKPLLKK